MVAKLRGKGATCLEYLLELGQSLGQSQGVDGLPETHVGHHTKDDGAQGGGHQCKYDEEVIPSSRFFYDNPDIESQ